MPEPQSVPGSPEMSRKPSRSLTNAKVSGPGTRGSARSSHASPRSVERKRRVPATSAHTSGPDGALSCANDGSAIGEGDGEVVGVGAGAAVVATAVGKGVGDVAAFGWLEHAVRTRARANKARIPAQRL